MSQLLPLFLKLDGQPVLLVGAGTVAQAKLSSLLRAGAAIHVVALSISPAFRALAEAHGDQVHLEARAVALGDLWGKRLVISATNDPLLNARMGRRAQDLGLWFNAVDDPRHCRFHLAASFQRGPLQLAIGTEGEFPGLAGALRAFLEEAIPEGDDHLLGQLAELRTRIRRNVPDPKTRTQALRRVLDGLKRDYFHAIGALAELS